MKITLAKYAGFCYGVDNAIKIAEKTIKNNTNKSTYLLGELVHNEEVIKKIKKQNIKIINEIDKIPKNSTVILSAHGHSPEIYKEAKERNLNVVDATCPMVTKVHILGKMLAKEKYYVVIIGDKRHNEVKAIYSQIKALTDKINILENIKDVEKIKNQKKIGIISQTTQSLQHFSEIVGEISKHISEIKIFNTICDATRFRQTTALELATKTDMMIVVGSSHSANTNRLTEICNEVIESYRINSVKELKKNWFDNKKHIGITAGASTPDWIIKEVTEYIKKYN